MHAPSWRGELSDDSDLGPMTGEIYRGEHKMLTKISVVFLQLFSEADGYLVSQQVEESRAALPIFATFHLLATSVVANLVWAQVPLPLLALWAGINVILGLVLISGYAWMRRKSGNVPAARRVLGTVPFVALGICLSWGWANFGFGGLVQPRVSGLIEILQIIVLVVGLLSSLRLPAASVQFVLAIVAVLLVEASSAYDGFGISALLVGVMCFAGLTIAVLALSISMRRRWALEKYRKRDAEIIKLLLHDMGSEIRDWMWETDAGGMLVSHSPNLPSVLNEIPGTLTGRNFFDEVFAIHAPTLMPRFNSQETFTDENFETAIAGDQRQWQLSAKPLFDPNGTFIGYRGVARDVTFQRQQERLIASARDEAQKANDAKSQFLAVISHELRTPINAIVGFSEVLSAGQGETLPLTARREYLGTILESAKHLQGLINDILEATRMERGNIKLDEQPSDVAELVEISVKIVRESAIQRGISVIARVIEDVEVTGDVTRLKQVLLNILTNAIKFSPEGGMVQVDMKRDGFGNLLISVRDAGIGISREDAERVFEPFVQVEGGSSRRFGGMGLGLAIARRVARLHGGDLALNGEAGIGTEALFTLPAVRIGWPKPRGKIKSASAA